MISHAVRREARREEGFTLLELLVVVIILGILTAIAIPSYLSFRGRAEDVAAKADVRSIVPSIESYYSDTGSYAGMTLSILASSYDQAINVNRYTLAVPSPNTYCVQSPQGSGDHVHKKAGPAAGITKGTC